MDSYLVLVPFVIAAICVPAFVFLEKQSIQRRHEERERLAMRLQGRYESKASRLSGSLQGHRFVVTWEQLNRSSSTHYRVFGLPESLGLRTGRRELEVIRGSEVDEEILKTREVIETLKSYDGVFAEVAGGCADVRTGGEDEVEAVEMRISHVVESAKALERARAVLPDQLIDRFVARPELRTLRMLWKFYPHHKRMSEVAVVVDRQTDPAYRLVQALAENDLEGIERALRNERSGVAVMVEAIERLMRADGGTRLAVAEPHLLRILPIVDAAQALTVCAALEHHGSRSAFGPLGALKTGSSDRRVREAAQTALRAIAHRVGGESGQLALVQGGRVSVVESTSGELSVVSSSKPDPS